jgi:hypothetical protein
MLDLLQWRTTFEGSFSRSITEILTTAASGAPVAKVSMLYGEPNKLYERALKTHEVHAARHGYPLHVLRHEVANFYWNKPYYILSMLVTELSKDPSQRLAWIM